MGRTKQISDADVLKAAREVFVEKGFGASTREIALRAGVSEAVLYQRHKSKLSLFFASMIPPPIELSGPGTGTPPHGPSTVDAHSLPDDPDGSEELKALGLEVMKYFRGAMPVLLQLVTHPSFNVAELAESQTHMPMHGLAEAIGACLERQRQRGKLTSDVGRLQIATLTLVATLHSLALFERMGVHGSSFPDQTVRSIVDLIAAGLAPDKGAGP